MNLLIKDLLGSDGLINPRFTCQGSNVSPHIEWIGAPPGTKSFALYVHDPDAPDPAAPKMDWIHWIVINIPAGVNELLEASSKQGLEVVNDSGRQSYHGPCPPIGVHRYYFKLFALSVDELIGVTKSNFLDKIKPYLIDSAELIGNYKKK